MMITGKNLTLSAVLQIFCLFSLTGLHTSAKAHEQETLFNTINLQVQVEADVPNNQMKVVLAAEKEGVDPKEISQSINKSMRWALDIAQGYPGVISQTGNYRTSPVYSKQTISSWRAVQELMLESESIDDLSRLTGVLQERLQVKGMSFRPSADLLGKYEDDLVDEGMRAFRNRAEQLRKHMNNMQYRIVTIHINSGRQSPPVVYETSTVRSNMSMASPPPAVDAGSSKLTVTVSGMIQFF